MGLWHIWCHTTGPVGKMHINEEPTPGIFRKNRGNRRGQKKGDHWTDLPAVAWPIYNITCVAPIFAHQSTKVLSNMNRILLPTEMFSEAGGI